MSSIRQILGNVWRAAKLAGKHDDAANVERLLPMLRMLKRRPGVLRWRGKPLRYADAPSAYYQLAEIFVGKIYDFEHRSKTPPPRILDVGGNIGLASLWFRERHPQGDITTFEPDPGLAEIIRSNLQTFGDEQTQVVEAAAWTHSGEIGFSSTGDDSGSVQFTSATRVPCIDLAEHFERPVDFLKLDIEGAEFEVINHLRETGALSQVRHAFIELHHWDGAGPPRFHEVFSALADAGLHYRILESLVTPSPVTWSALRQSNSMIGVVAWSPQDPSAPR